MASITDFRERDQLIRRGIRLEYLTIGYNAIETVVAVAAGVAAGSLALVAFGLDSMIEIIAGTAVLWRLKPESGKDSGKTGHIHLEKRALRIVGLTFFALAIYIIGEAIYDVAAGNEATVSTAGMLLAMLSLAIMPLLALLKQRVARGIGSKALAADAVETWMCSYLSLALLTGLLLNAVYGWAWADTLAALAMLPLIIREGWEAVMGEEDE